MGEVSINVTNIDSLPSFSKFQFTAPRALLEALLQLNEPDSMHVNVSTRNDEPIELSVNRTSDDNIQIQADGGNSPVLEGVDDRWNMFIKSVDGPIYLVTGGSENHQDQQAAAEPIVEAQSLLDQNVIQKESSMVYATDSEVVDSAVVGTVVSVTDFDSKAVEVEKAYPEIVRSLHINQEHIQDVESENEGDMAVDVISSVLRQSSSKQPLRTDVDLLLAAIEASNAAEQIVKNVNGPKLDALKRKRGRPRKLRLETPDGIKEEDILAVMEEIPLIIQNVLTYKCYECEKAFTSIDTLKSHMKMKHDERMDNSRVTNSVLEQAHICFVCHRPTAGMKSLRKHLLGVHRLKYAKPKPKGKPRYVAKGLRRNPRDPNIPAVECELCGKKVVSWDNLRNHTNKLHKDYPNLKEVLKKIRDKRLKFHKRQSVVKVTCPICSDQFRGLPVLYHIKSVHGDSFEKEDLDQLLLQVKKDIQKSYNLLKKERSHYMKTFECTICQQSMPLKDMNIHKQRCRRENLLKKDDVQVHCPGIKHQISEGSGTGNATKEEVGIDIGNISGSPVPQNVEPIITQQTQSPTKMFSLLNRKVVNVCQQITTNPVESTAGHETTTAIAEAEVADPTKINEPETILLYSPEMMSSAMSGDVSFMVVKAETSDTVAETSQEKTTKDSIETGWAKVEGLAEWSQRRLSRIIWPKPCPTCGKKLNNSKAMAHHRRYVHFEELRRPLQWHVCEICNKKMPNKNRLDKHMTVHTGYRRFQCKECDGAFKDKYTLNSHIRIIHNKSYRYVCDKCGKGWDKISGRNNHKCLETSVPANFPKEAANLNSENTVDKDGENVDYIIVQPNSIVEDGEINYLQDETSLDCEKGEREEGQVDYLHQLESPTAILSNDRKLNSSCLVTLPRTEEMKDTVQFETDTPRISVLPKSNTSETPAVASEKVSDENFSVPEDSHEKTSRNSATLETQQPRHSEAENTKSEAKICIKAEINCSDPNTKRKSFRAKKQKVVMDL